MAVMSVPGNFNYYNELGSTSVGATTVGVQGPDIATKEVFVSIPSAGIDSWITDSAGVGGTYLLAGSVVGPIRVDNLNRIYFKKSGGAGQTTIGLMYTR